MEIGSRSKVFESYALDGTDNVVDAAETLLSSNEGFVDPVAPSPAALTIGDIYFVAYFGQGTANAGAGNPSPEGFAIFFRNAVAAGEVINFTDGALQSNGTSFATNESTVVFTVGAGGIPAGTTVQFPLNGSNQTTVYANLSSGGRAAIGTITPTGNTGLSNSGDQLFAYQGTAASATVLAGIDVSSSAIVTTGATNTNNTYAPTNGAPFLDMPAGTNNVQININPTTATPAQLTTAGNFSTVPTSTNPETSMTTIQSSFTLPTISVTTTTLALNEGDSGTTNFTFTLTRTSTTGSASINYSVAGSGVNPADAGDFVGGAAALTGTAVFADGSATATITIPVSGDTSVETDETFTVTLGTAPSGYTLGATTTATGTIQNDDVSATPNLTINDVVQAETNAGTTIFTFTVSLSAPAPAGGVTFDIATADGTGTAGSDYVARSLTSQTIPAGQSTYTFDVTVNGDAVAELNETFLVNVTNVTGATVTDGQGQATITNDDATLIPAGTNLTTPFAVSAAGNYELVAGTTRTQTTGVGVNVANNVGAANIAINGTLDDTANQQRAINVGTGNNGASINIGAAGAVRSVAIDAIRNQTTTGTVNLNNQGAILVSNNGTTVMPNVNPGNAHAVQWNAAVGTSASAADYASGGTITNGAVGNTAASIVNNFFGDAVRMGSHMTLNNYGSISANGLVNDTIPDSQTTFYSVGRGVRLDTANTTAVQINNFGSIAGSQHGVDATSGASNIVITNASGATITGRNGSGIGSDSLQTDPASITITNSGTITGAYAGVGNIFDRAGNASVDGDGDGIDIDGAVTINNLAGGIVEATGFGGFDTGGRANNSEAVAIGGGIVNNAGIIRGATRAILVNNDSNTDGSRSGVAATTVNNYAGGTITGQTGFAIRFENKTATAADNDTITNYGTITGNGTVPAGTVLLQDGSPDPRTVGTLDGVTYTSADAGSARFIRGDGSAIQTGQGADTLVNYGTITGNSGLALNMEGGDDALTLFTGSTVTGTLNGGTGSDTLTLALDDRGAGNLVQTGANSGVTTGSVGLVSNFETLSVTGGSWTVSDSQSYVSGFSVAAGATLTVGTGATLAVGSGSSLTGSLVLTGNASVTTNLMTTLAGGISGGGALTKAGTGLLILSGANSYSGGTTINAGALSVAAVGAAGTGAITFTAGAQTLIVANSALDVNFNFGNTISGFSNDGDALVFDGIAAATSLVAYNNTTGLLTITDRTSGAVLATANLGAGLGGNILNVVSDNGSGMVITFAANNSTTGTPGTAGNDTVTGTTGSDVFNLSQGGNDTVAGGDGDDGFVFGAAYTSTDVVDGGAGSLDQLGLRGDYSAGVTLGTITGVENVVLLSGSNTRFGGVNTDRFSYNITAADANVAAGQTLVISGNTLLETENFTFNGAAELDGKFFFYGGLGTETLTGGQQDDGFYFGQNRWSASDTVDGQGGTLDQLGLQGNYSGGNAVVFGAGQITGIENIVLLSGADGRFGGPGTGFNYDLTMNDDNVLVGTTFAISANMLAANETLTLNASAETDVGINVFSGAGNDILVLGQQADTVFGGAGTDRITGNAGADQLTGGAGNDSFVYLLAADSTAAAQDHLLDFASGDSIDIAALGSFTFIGTGSFTNSAGQLRATNTSGSDWLVEGDINGDGTADLSILVTSDHAITIADFTGSVSQAAVEPVAGKVAVAEALPVDAGNHFGIELFAKEALPLNVHIDSGVSDIVTHIDAMASHDFAY